MNCWKSQETCLRNRRKHFTKQGGKDIIRYGGIMYLYCMCGGNYGCIIQQFMETSD